MNMKRFEPLVFLSFLFLLSLASISKAGELFAGSATTSITPSRPVALSGQRQTRIARDVQRPVTATAVALQTKDGEQSLDQAIMVSCDLVAIRDEVNLQKRVRERVRSNVPEIQVKKIFLSATHTHTAPVMVDDLYHISEEGVMQPDAYTRFLVEKLTGVIVEAWNKREKAGVSWGLGHAVVGRNRRATYRDGTAKMYGKTSGKRFRGLEGAENHLVDTLFFWTPQKELTAAAINVACPAQEVESRSSINADYWHPVRKLLDESSQNTPNVLGWIGAAGDQSPHLMYYRKAEERMRKLRGLSRLEEIARRVHQAVEESRRGAEEDVRFDVPFEHVVKEIKLPMRMVSEEEYDRARARLNQLNKKQALSRSWYQGVVDRYRRQETSEGRLMYAMELHVIRLGDVVICTNPFELYTTYGNQIKARSPATQTFVVQLATASGGYLPTEKAVRGGGYSAEVMSNPVGPEGGHVLVDKTVNTIHSLWEEEK